MVSSLMELEPQALSYLGLSPTGVSEKPGRRPTFSIPLPVHPCSQTLSLTSIPRLILHHLTPQHMDSLPSICPSFLCKLIRRNGSKNPSKDRKCDDKRRKKQSQFAKSRPRDELGRFLPLQNKQLTGFESRSRN